MDEMNCIVIQGHLEKDAEVVEKGNRFTCNLDLLVAKTGSKNNSYFHFPVVVKGKVAKLFRDILIQGSVVRIAGALSEKKGNIFIAAESLEIRK